MLNEYEQFLSNEINSRFQTTDFLTRFRRFCSYMIYRFDFDIIFVDLNPSSSFLNQNIIVQSDNLILPCSADEYAYYAIRTFGLWLNTWLVRYRPIVKNPKLLTIIYNKYKINVERVTLNNKRYFCSQAHVGYINRLINPDGAIDHFLSLPNVNLLINPGINYRQIPLIRDGLSTMAKMQSLNRTCYDLIDGNYHYNDGLTIKKMIIEYDILWNKICIVYNWLLLIEIIPDNLTHRTDND